MRYFATVALAALVVLCAGAFALDERDLFPVATAGLIAVFGLPLIHTTVDFWLGPEPPNVLVADEEREWL